MALALKSLDLVVSANAPGRLSSYYIERLFLAVQINVSGQVFDRAESTLIRLHKK